MDRIRFAPAGGCALFHEAYRSNIYLPEFIASYGLNGLEYQCGRGVNISDDTAEQIREKCAAGDIEVSLHTPYYISLSSVDPEKRVKSVDYILQSAEAIRKLGGRRIVVHAGSCSKLERSVAVGYSLETLINAQKALDEHGYGEVIVCPETLGKLNQLGTVEEICTLCGADERMLPCVDFGHVNSMTNGSLRTQSDYAALLDTIENALGYDRMKRMHIHFSKIEYTQKGGEVRHLTFADEVYGPWFEPLAEEIARRGMTPFVVSESAGTQTEDAAAMQRMYEQALSRQ